MDNMTPTSDIPAAYAKARTRLLLLDYDGTLTDFAPTPPEARPDKQLLDLLAELCKDRHNTVVIVSGRDRKTLENWLGDLPLTLIAEHGHFLKRPGQDWEALTMQSDDWKTPVRQKIETTTKGATNTFIEEKSTALVWHYRLATQPMSHAAKQLHSVLEPLAQKYGLIVVPGNKIVEIRSAGTDKGDIASGWVALKNWDFMLAAGDDTTDEDLFAAMPDTAFTVKIGSGPTSATARLDSPTSFLELLKSFVVKSK